ncbi:MAG TPA: NAD-dependent epimerase/dehydratase family protein, partial [bacterium]|nr:NAD-dependent epimerase/dehydratase family protein [bacterium]
YGSVASGKSKEVDILDPTSPYSSSKAAADLIALSYHKTFGLPVMITRSSNNFGPYQHPEKFIPLFITNAIEGKKLPLYGDGKNIRNWIYVEDNCAAVDAVLRKGKPGGIYNIGGRVEVKNRAIADAVIKALKADPGLLVFVKDRPAHDRRYALDSSKAEKLGWRCKYDFKEALAKTVKWYSDNREWWERLKCGMFKSYYKKLYGRRG